MAWKFNNESPIYLQIVDAIKMQIAQGTLKPGDQVPAVRELALTAGVNPNTMQKALTELERTGLVYSQRTSGRFITEDAKMIEELKNNLAQEQIKEFLENMSKLGYKKSETLSLIQEILEGEQA